jgi:hypothetical protein
LKTQYLLIDYENVQPKTLAMLNGRSFKILVFVGAHQSKIPVEFAEALQPLGSDVEYVRISGDGSNALDFHIAFRIGELSKTDPEAHYHIVSKDKGFEPLIPFALQRGVHISRSNKLLDIPPLTALKNKIINEKVDTAIQNLTSRGTGRPRKVETLKNTINALFQKTLEDDDINDLIQKLKKRKFISVEAENVSYHPSSAC